MIGEIRGLTHQLVRTTSTLYEAELQKKQSELLYLRSEINPHFLYNTLESIMGMAYLENAPQTAQMVKNLGEIFKYSVKGQDMVSVQEELSTIQAYLSIQQMRFEGLEHQAGGSSEMAKSESQSAAAIRLEDSAEKIDAVLHGLGISEDEPKWMIHILQGQIPASLESQFQKNKIWKLSGIGICWFLISGSDAPEEAIKILRSSSMLCAAGISQAFFSGKAWNALPLRHAAQPLDTFSAIPVCTFLLAPWKATNCLKCCGCCALPFIPET